MVNEKKELSDLVVYSTSLQKLCFSMKTAHLYLSQWRDNDCPPPF
jgi:hypothetical protein